MTEKNIHKNRIAVNFHTKTIEVESSNESLNKVYGVFNTIAIKMGEKDQENVERRKKIVDGIIG